MVVDSSCGPLDSTSSSQAVELGATHSYQMLSTRAAGYCGPCAIQTNDAEVPRARLLEDSARTPEVEMVDDEHRNRRVSQRGLDTYSGSLPRRLSLNGADRLLSPLLNNLL